MSKEENNCIIIFLTYIWCVHCWFTRSNLLFDLTNILTILKYSGFMFVYLFKNTGLDFEITTLLILQPITTLSFSIIPRQ